MTRDKRETYLEQIMHGTVSKYGIEKAVPYENLSEDIMIELSHKVKIKWL